MRAYRYLVVLLFALAACATLQTPQQVINEANTLVIVAAQQISEYKATGQLTQSEAQEQLDKVKKFRADAVEAQKLLDKGESVLAVNKATATRALIKQLQEHVAKKAREAHNVQ